MDYQEVIERITDHKETHFRKEYPRAIKITEALETAISAVHELQEYKKYGTPNGYKSALEAYEKCYFEKEEVDIELYKYKQLGTLDEVSEAMEKQKAKKPNNVGTEGYRYTDTYRCPTCGGNFSGTGIANYCYHCGQAIDWGEEE